jgi:hypothetical protein
VSNLGTVQELFRTQWGLTGTIWKISLALKKTSRICYARKDPRS